MDWASPKITKFSKCQTGPPLKSSLDGGDSPESLINWILGEAGSGMVFIELILLIIFEYAKILIGGVMQGPGAPFLVNLKREFFMSIKNGIRDACSTADIFNG